MSLSEDILQLLRSEGYEENEVIVDALNDFIAVVLEENEDEDFVEEEDED